jgi:predicted CoA-binding protein
MTGWQDRKAVDFMLDECETWAVVGLSGDPRRTAYRFAAALQQAG